MKFLKLFEEYNILNKFSSYNFSNKIVKNKANALQNAINIKGVIHTACEWCLDNSCQIFMFEIAIAETGLGTSSKSDVTTGTIGRSVFHIDKGTFEWTQIKHPRINRALENLKKKGIDWQKVSWNDLSKNILLGAIGCKLVLLKKGMNRSNSGKLSTLNNRAKVYAIKYNGGGTKQAEENYKRNVLSWLNYLKDKGAEYLVFRNKKYPIKETGLTS
jgi:hypothetical protein